MLDSDALILGEDFVSEHYFTTDVKAQSFQAKVLERRKAWDTAREDDQETSLSRFLPLCALGGFSSARHRSAIDKLPSYYA